MVIQQTSSHQTSLEDESQEHKIKSVCSSRPASDQLNLNLNPEIKSSDHHQTTQKAKEVQPKNKIIRPPSDQPHIPL